MSEPHEIRGPYEAYIVMTKRKDGRAPDLCKSVGCVNDGGQSTERHLQLFETLESAQRCAYWFNADWPENIYPYAAFKVHVTVVEECR